MTATIATARAVDGLIGIVGAEHCLTGDAMLPFATDVYRCLHLPLAVVRPGTVEQVQAIARFAHEAGIGLSVRGGGASYTDAYLPREAGQILIDMAGLNRIVTIDEADAYVTVEAGVTWATLKQALDARGLRTPFWGPFSGIAATVGGSLSQNTISHGSAAHGISAQSVQALDIVLADGRMLRTGSAVADLQPFSRFFGPDLTGLFTGDAGAFGIKVRATFPLLKVRPAHRPISFSFPDFPSIHEAMRRSALERLEDTHFAIDAALSQGQIARQDRAGATMGMALSILRSSPSLAHGLRQLVQAGVSARRVLNRSAYMLHYIVEGVDDAEVRARLARIRTLLKDIGREIPATVPAVVRGMPFAPLYNTLGPNGERWVPLHGILPHSATPGFHRALEAFYAARADDLRRHGVWTGGMFGTVGSSGFLYEIAIYWPDEITAYHRAMVPADYRDKLPTFPADPAARAYVHQLKEDLIALYVEHGAINFQLGKAYPYAARLDAAPLDLVRAIKTALDPDGRVSPGNLGL